MTDILDRLVQDHQTETIRQAQRYRTLRRYFGSKAYHIPEARQWEARLDLTVRLPEAEVFQSRVLRVELFESMFDRLVDDSMERLLRETREQR